MNAIGRKGSTGAQRGRPGRQENRRRLRWPRVIVELAAAASEGSQAVAEAGIRVVRALVAADSAALVRWQDGNPVVLAEEGNGLAFESRPPEGPGWAAGRPLAVVSVDPRTDLVVARSAPVRFEDGDLESLRALGELIRWSCADPAPDIQLWRFATRVVCSLELDEVLVSTADAISHLLRAEIAGVLLLGASGDDLEMRCTIGNTKLDTARLRIRAGQGLAGRVLESGRPERIDDYSTDPRSAPEFMALSDLEGTCSAIAVPLRSDGRISGVLCAWRRRREPFTERDQSLFEALSELCGGAVHNAGCFEEQRSRAQHYEAEQRALHERHQAVERDLRVQAELTRIAVEGRDVSTVVRTLSRLTSSSAVIVTDDGRVLGPSSRGSADRLGARQAVRLRRLLPTLGDDREPVVAEQDDGSWLLVARVRAAGVTFGHLVLALTEVPTPGDRMAAGQAAVVSALLLAREEAAVAAARRVQSEFVWDVLEGRLPDSVEAGVRAQHLGIGFTLPARVVAVEIRGLAEAAADGGWKPECLERVRNACSRLISKELDKAGSMRAVFARRADLFALVVPCTRHDALTATRRLAQAVAAIRWPDDLSASVGVGGPVERVTRFPDGWREAQLAGSAAGSSVEPGVFEDLGVLRFLLAPTSRDELDGFARRQLGRLLDYDAAHRTELMRTVAVYLATGCSTRRTAERMCIHHRTVAYRLQRVRELTGFRLDDQEDRFHLQLACKILSLNRQPEVVRSR